ncbi:MAG: hypothetical protein H6807_16115 [Planctomycetes bacterium]|nr:hypothetical protein [Planctomycetota bacterium]
MATEGQSHWDDFDSPDLRVYVGGVEVQATVTPNENGSFHYLVDGADVTLPGPIEFKNGGTVVATEPVYP